jgi:hypothetical protein
LLLRIERIERIERFGGEVLLIVTTVQGGGG